jgi:prepilin-type N-terminal cleavage/methylation domain-containing protein
MTTMSSGKRAPRGFTLIEILVVLGILGIFLAASFPSILKVLAVRNLDNATRQVQTYLQMTKLRAVDTKIVHRVRFYQADEGYWVYEMERLQPDGTWARVGEAPRKTIPAEFNVTVTFPADGADHQAVFSPLGTFPEFAVNQNSLTLQSPKLDRPDQMDERVLSIFMGGSIHYAKRKST